MYSERVSRSLRLRVQERAKGLCEYCVKHLPIVLVPLFTVSTSILGKLEVEPH